MMARPGVLRDPVVRRVEVSEKFRETGSELHMGAGGREHD